MNMNNILIGISIFAAAFISALLFNRRWNKAKQEMVSTAYDAEQAQQKAKESWWYNQRFLIFETIAFSVADGLFLYTVFDKAMLQSMYLGVIMAFSFSMLLNMIPIYAARFVCQAVYKTTPHAGLFAVITIVVFFMLYGSTVYLRIAYHDMYGQSSAVALTNTLDDSSSGEVIEDDVQDMRSYAVVILLSIEPLATSVCNFVISYLSENEAMKERNALSLLLLKLLDKRARCRAALKAMDREVQTELDMDMKRKEAAVALAMAIGLRLKAEARSYLAMYLKDPASISRLSHELYTNDNSDSCTVYEYPQLVESCEDISESMEV